ncbi:MAG: phosphatase PAP2 family protein [Bacteroidales bacterium]|nr:phosphatase PAP2 family protein [Bacteroidales bacterium]
MRSFFGFLLLVLSFALSQSCSVGRGVVASEGQKVPTYFTIDQMPDLVKCLPAPPAWKSQEFQYDSIRYFWGKALRADSARAAVANSDAVWSLESLFASFKNQFGLTVSKETTPEIWKLLETSISTIDLIRIRPKAHFLRKRPFEYFNDHILTTWEEDELRGEGSYPSGHTIRGWSAALLLAEINPEAANEIFARGWEYGESRVIVGAHWQSDVDASRAAASIAYDKLQTSPVFRKQMARAVKEFKRLSVKH